MNGNMSMSMHFNDKQTISDISIPKTTPVIWILVRMLLNVIIVVLIFPC